MGVIIRLADLLTLYPIMEFNPKKFAAATFHMQNPHVTLLVFGSGKVVCTGAKSEADALLASSRMVTLLQQMGVHRAQLLEFKIQNIVTTASAGFDMELEVFRDLNSLLCTYDPDQFPGARYRMSDPKVVFEIFTSGKVIIAGARCREDVERAWEECYNEVLLPFKTERRPGNSADYVREMRKFIPLLPELILFDDDDDDERTA